MKDIEAIFKEFSEMSSLQKISTKFERDLNELSSTRSVKVLREIRINRNSIIFSLMI